MHYGFSNVISIQNYSYIIKNLTIFHYYKWHWSLFIYSLDLCSTPSRLSSQENWRPNPG